ncbi:MAG: STAS domain-containing protein [Steroidobacteraceae bacterium]
MNVNIESTEGGVSVARAHGRLDFGASAEFQKALEGAVGAKPKALVVECSELEYVSSAGLRAFLVAARAAKAGGVGFAACALQPAVKEVFEVSGFSKIIDVQADLATALAALA